MPRGIVSQSEQYGLPHREARELPPAAEVSDLLAGHGIVPGLMKRRATHPEYEDPFSWKDDEIQGRRPDEERDPRDPYGPNYPGPDAAWRHHE